MSNVEVVGSGFVSKGEIPIFGFVPEEEDNSDGENEDDNLEQAEGNDEDDEDDELEDEAARVEVGFNIAVMADGLEKGNPYFIILCDKPLFLNLETFTDDWVTTGPKESY
jgi:hypothetical protein